MCARLLREATSLLVLAAALMAATIEVDTLEELKNVKVILALRDVSNSLNCIQDVMKDSLHLAERTDQSVEKLDIEVTTHRDDLERRISVAEENILHALTNSVAELKEETKNLKDSSNFDKTKTDKLAQENVQLKLQLSDERLKVQQAERDLEIKKKENEQNILKVAELKEETKNLKASSNFDKTKMEKLAQEIDQLKLQLTGDSLKVHELEIQIEDKNNRNALCLSNVLQTEKELDIKIKENQQNILKAQDLERGLKESQRFVEDLKQNVTHLNSVVELQRRTKQENHGNDEKQNTTKQLVQEYERSMDWSALRRGLETVLDAHSEAYRQLQDIEYSTNSPLYVVGYKGYMTLATVLLSGGLPLDTVDSSGNSLLYGAAQGGQVALVKELVHRGAGLEIRDNSGRTALMGAAYRGHLGVVRLLVFAGANTAAVDNRGLSALDLTRIEGHTQVSQYLTRIHL